MCESGALVPGDQTPVRLCKDLISRLGQEHGAADHVVCAVEPMGGAPAVIELCGKGAPVAAQNQGNSLVLIRLTAEKPAPTLAVSVWGYLFGASLKRL